MILSPQPYPHYMSIYWKKWIVYAVIHQPELSTYKIMISPIKKKKNNDSQGSGQQWGCGQIYPEFVKMNMHHWSSE